jgi:hypothetical protein
LPDLKQESTSFAGLHSDVLQDTIRLRRYSLSR